MDGWMARAARQETASWCTSEEATERDRRRASKSAGIDAALRPRQSASQLCPSRSRAHFSVRDTAAFAVCVCIWAFCFGCSRPSPLKLSVPKKRACLCSAASWLWMGWLVGSPSRRGLDTTFLHRKSISSLTHFTAPPPTTLLSIPF